MMLLHNQVLASAEYCLGPCIARGVKRFHANALAQVCVAIVIVNDPRRGPHHRSLHNRFLYDAFGRCDL